MVPVIKDSTENLQMVNNAEITTAKGKSLSESMENLGEASGENETNSSMAELKWQEMIL